MLMNRAYEQLTTFANVAVRPLGKLSRSVSQLFIVFCNIGNCLWKGLHKLKVKITQTPFQKQFAI